MLDLIVPFFMISLVKQQEVWYIFPMIPPMALFAGHVVSRMVHVRSSYTKYLISLMGMLLAVGFWGSGGKAGNHFLSFFEFIKYFVPITALIISGVVIGGKKNVERFLGKVLLFIISLGFLGLNAPKFRMTALSYMHRDATLWRNIGLQLRRQKRVNTPVVMNFRYFPRNVIMFYAHYNSIQLRSFSHKVILPGEVYYGVLLMVPTCRLFLKGLQVQKIKQFPFKCPLDLLRIKNVSPYAVIPCKGRASFSSGKSISFLSGNLSIHVGES